MLDSFSSAPLPKRKRLSYACNYCRAKKTRCDEQFPSCQNCQLAGVPCVTVDKRRPSAPVQHRRKDLPITGRSLDMEATGLTALASPEATGVSCSSSQITPPAVATLSRSASPVARGPNEWSNWDTRHLPVIPTRPGSSVVQIATQWLDLALSRLRVPRSNHVRASLSPCLASPNPPCDYAVAAVEPALPPLDELHTFAELFLKVYHVVYPFLDRQKMLLLLNEVPDIRHNGGRIRRDGKASTLLLLYLIPILGTMASPTVSEQRLNTYLGYCHSLVGHLILQPSIQSVQALLLFSMTLRLRDQLSQAWDVLALAISMSKTLRLADLTANLQSTHGSKSSSDKGSLRTWWALYVFEKFLAFDSGQNCSLDDPILSSVGRQTRTEALEHGSALDLQDYEHYLTSLANVLREMQHRSWHTWQTQSLDTTSEANARASKIRAAGAIDTLLWKWRVSLPLNTRGYLTPAISRVGTPGSTDVQLTPQWAFLSFYYHLAIIVLYRNTLLLDWNEVKGEVDRDGSGEPWHIRLRNGPQIYLEAARDMVSLQVTVSEAGEPSFLALGTSPLAAVYVFVIQIRRQPGSILTRTHSELMKAAMAVSQQRHSFNGAGSALHGSLEALVQYVAQLIGETASRSSVQVNLESVEVSHDSMSTRETLPDPLEPPSLTWGSFEMLTWDWNELVPQG